MLLIFHVVVAMLGLVLASASLVKPNNTLIRIGVVSGGTTFVSGAVLIILGSASLVHTCVVGLVYFTIVIGSLAYSSRKLAYRSI